MEKKEKMAQETQTDEESKEEKTEEKSKPEEEQSEDSIVYKDQTFTVGDFIYIEPR